MERVRVDVADGTTMTAHVVRPSGAVRYGIVLFHEAFGVTEYVLEIAARFARELRCAVIAPELYHRTGDGVVTPYDAPLPQDSPHRKGLTPEGIAADAIACYDRLRAEGVERVVAVGYCMGGRAAYLANASAPFAAAVSFYGNKIPEWPGELAARQHGPLLFFWGGLDRSIPAEQRRAVEDALTRAGSVAHTHVLFSDADHGFFNHARPVYHAQASRLAWAALVEFLERYGVTG